MTERDTGQHGARRSDDAFAQVTGDLLRRSADDIDTATASRLQRARQAALREVRDRRRRPPGLVPALAAGAVGVLAVGLWLSRGAAPAPPAAGSAVVESAADMDLLLAADSLEMLEDLEFYAWFDADRSPAELRAELEPAG